MSDKLDNKIKKEKTNKDNRKKYKRIPVWITWVMLLVLAAVCIFLTTWIKKNTKEFEPKEKFVTYSMGTKLYHDVDLVLKRKNDITYLGEDENVESDGSPLIYEGQHKYLIPVNMAYLDPNSDIGAKRVNYFSTISGDIEQHKATVSYNGKESGLDAGFLYDGNGTFIFMEEVELQIGSMRCTLSPMSYVRVYYRDSVEVFNMKTDEYQYIELLGNEVKVEAKTGYGINLGTNVLTKDDAPRILFSNIEAMGVFE